MFMVVYHKHEVIQCILDFFAQCASGKFVYVHNFTPAESLLPILPLAAFVKDKSVINIM